ncbi:MAG TPA: DNA-protecting protein DprA, partial [Lactobacillus johnsonii]|nr:DNA-protecting protein DprA [Lactobacillus johnsonii]
RKRSGSLITANIALEENRNIFAVPGPVSSPLSEGPNELIAAGAYPLVNADFKNLL